jgi:hypothetical protein
MVEETRDTGMASLQFEEFSYEDKDEGNKPSSMAIFGKIHDYVVQQFPMVDTIQERVPYMIVWCNDAIPAPSQWPFMIAGLLIVSGSFWVNTKNHLSCGMMI